LNSRLLGLSVLAFILFGSFKKCEQSCFTAKVGGNKDQKEGKDSKNNGPALLGVETAIGKLCSVYFEKKIFFFGNILSHTRHIGKHFLAI
jgi:hypothetical protein